ncbi:cell division protein FtsK [Pseudonocardia sichuanensis]
MTLEIRKPGTVDVRSPIRQRARTYVLEVRARATAVTRRQAWTAWQLLRQVPGTLVLLVRWSPRGLGRATAAWARYLRDHDTVELRGHHTEGRETDHLVKVEQMRSAHLRARLMINGTLLLLVLAVVLAWTSRVGFGVLVAGLVFWWTVKLIPGRELWEYAVAAGLAVVAYLAAPRLAAYIPQPPAWVWWAVGAVAVLVLGWVGRPRERQLVKLPESMQGGRVPPLTAPMVTAALTSLGNSKMKEPDDVRLLTDPHRHGPGVQVDLELPPAVTASWVMDKREEFAAALRREIGTVWPSRGVRHPGHLALFVSDQPMSQAAQAPWPLRNGGEVDLFQPQRQFTDQRGHWVDITLAYANVVIGAVPRMGKTFIERQLLVVAGLDVRARVAALDGKGTGDFAPLRPFLDFYSVGDEDEEYERVLQYLRGLKLEMRRRAGVIRSLPFERCPENKVTSALADDRSLGLEPIVVGIDETQVYFEDAPKLLRTEYASLVTDLVKRGPALGIIVVLATQSVTKDTIPTGISNNAVIRVCLKMEGHEQNDRVLGTGAYKRGLDAQMFDINDKGIAYLKAEGSEPRIVRSVFGLDAVEAGRLAEVARQMRAASGRLTGEAADAPAVPVLDIVADVARVLTDRGRDAAQHVELVEWLRALRPDYEALDVDELSARLRNRQVRIGQVKREGRNLQGVDLRKQDPDCNPFRSYLGQA